MLLVSLAKGTSARRALKKPVFEGGFQPEIDCHRAGLVGNTIDVNLDRIIEYQSF